MNQVLHLDKKRKQRLPIKHVAGNTQFVRHFILIDQERRSEEIHLIECMHAIGHANSVSKLFTSEIQVEYIEHVEYPEISM